MKCFNHRDQDAVALCKQCGKGLCQHCLVESSAGTSCHGKCEEDLSTAYALFQREKTTFLKTSLVYKRSGIFAAVMGVAFFAFGVWEKIPQLRIFLCTIGVLFLLGSLLFWKSAKEFRQV
jgi:hypothetical protein